MPNADPNHDTELMSPCEIMSHLLFVLLIFFKSSDFGKWLFIMRQATKETNTAMKLVHTNFVYEEEMERILLCLTKIKSGVQYSAQSCYDITTKKKNTIHPRNSQQVIQLYQGRRWCRADGHLHTDAPEDAPQTGSGHAS